jgi:uncharacterized protein (UPF0332 family)
VISAEDLIVKAEKALSSARILLDAEDTDGACNRAYYAIYDAARAALIKAGYEEIALTTKTHNGLISAFSMNLVKTNKLPVELGRIFNKVEDMRLMADYLEKSIEVVRSEWAVEQAEIFITQVKTQIF